MPKNPDPKIPKRSNEALRYADLGWRMLVIVLAGVFGGRWLDTKFPATKPLFVVGLSMLALGASMYMLIRAGSKRNNNKSS
ncbi:MAG: AtpZ/AtpI family protein [Bacteroidia bacterium]|nr:AtpZ/AtpI family protein [Bacteroidia bacterium]